MELYRQMETISLSPLTCFVTVVFHSNGEVTKTSCLKQGESWGTIPDRGYLLLCAHLPMPHVHTHSVIIHEEARKQWRACCHENTSLKIFKMEKAEGTFLLIVQESFQYFLRKIVSKFVIKIHVVLESTSFFPYGQNPCSV